MSDEIAIGWYGPTHDHWEWMLGHFRDVTLLTDRNVDAWIADQSILPDDHESKTPSTLLVASDSRFDSYIDFARKIEQAVEPKLNDRAQLPWCTLLGDDWAGHRRTHSLPETMQTFYWYELYDRLFPWLMNVSQSANSTKVSESNSQASKRPISPRVQRCIDTSLAIESRLRLTLSKTQRIRLAMVVTETSTARQLWNDALEIQGIKCFSTTPDNLAVWASPDLIVVDMESQPLAALECYKLAEIDSPCGDTIRELARQFPDAVLLATVPFPRWEHWNRLRECGADMIVAKPFQVTGIFDTLHRVSKS